MNIANKIAIGGVFCAAFLVLAVFGLTVKVETKPQTVSAATVSMMQINGTHGTNPRLANGSIIHVTWQAPAGYAYCNTGVSPAYAGVTSWGPYMDKPTSGSYSITIHESMRFQLQCAVDRSSPMTIEDGVAVDMISGGGTGGIACSNDSQCGISAYTGSPVCQSGNVYQNYITYTCQNPGTTNSRCVDPLVALQLKTTCTANQTCSAGACVNNTSNLVVSCTASPTSTQINQAVNFNSSVAGGTGTYAYSWTGGCVAGSQNCARTFTQPGTYTALLSVTSGSQTQTASCNVAIADTGTITCSTDSQCGTSGYTGSPSCSAGNVFQNYLNYTGTCRNAGTTSSYCASPASTYQLQTTCGTNQTCQNGACINNNGNTNNLVISCNASPTNIQAGNSTTFIGSAVGGNGIYSYTWTGACIAGSQNCSATFSQGGTYTALLSVTSGGQTQNTSCSVAVNGNNNNNCTQNANLRCVGTNSIYWFDSCNVQGAWYQTCGNNQYCSNGSCINNNNNNNYCSWHSYQSCSNGSVHWFDSCGVDQGISQACNSNQTCQGNTCVNQNINYYGNVIATTQVRNLSSGNLNWSTFVTANPSDILQYQITIQNNSNVNLNNVTVRDTLPPNLIYNNNLMIDGIQNGGSIIYGVNIGSLSSYQTRTVSYQARVAPAQNFVFGTTTLVNSTSVTSDNGNGITSSASVSVNRSGVLGATSVSTGLLTGNFWVDSFILPLILALIALWAWQAGLLNTFGIAEWVGGKKAKKNEVTAGVKLQEKINAIRNQENA